MNFQIGGTIPRPRSAITGCLHSRTEGRWKTRAQVEHSLDGSGGGVDRYHVSNNWLVKKTKPARFPPPAPGNKNDQSGLAAAVRRSDVASETFICETAVGNREKHSETVEPTLCTVWQLNQSDFSLISAHPSFQSLERSGCADACCKCNYFKKRLIRFTKQRRWQFSLDPLSRNSTRPILSPTSSYRLVALAVTIQASHFEISPETQKRTGARGKKQFISDAD